MGQFDRAIAQAVKAVELDPLSLIDNTNLALNFYYARRYEQSIEQFKQAKEIDENFYVAYLIGLPYEQKGMYKEAIIEFQKALSLSGENPGVLACLGHAYAMEGRRAEADEILATLDRLSNQRYISPYDKAVVLAALSEKDLAIEWLKKAHEEKDQNLTVVNVDPRLDPLRSDSGFTELLGKMGLERN
jgi:tetratricopeptide (TPR) repeat protein